MADLVVPQPPIIDGDGNINVHGREGISIPVKRWTDIAKTTQIDISGDTFSFEVEGKTPIPLIADPGDPKGLLLQIISLATAGIVVSLGQTPAFALRDTTGAVPIVRWEGRFVVRGWEGS